MTIATTKTTKQRLASFCIGCVLSLKWSLVAFDSRKFKHTDKIFTTKNLKCHCLTNCHLCYWTTDTAQTYLGQTVKIQGEVSQLAITFLSIWLWTPDSSMSWSILTQCIHFCSLKLENASRKTTSPFIPTTPCPTKNTDHTSSSRPCLQGTSLTLSRFPTCWCW